MKSWHDESARVDYGIFALQVQHLGIFHPSGDYAWRIMVQESAKAPIVRTSEEGRSAAVSEFKRLIEEAVTDAGGTVEWSKP